MRVIAFLLAAFVAYTLATEKVRFDNYKVYRATPTNKQQLQLLKDLESSGAYSFWSEVGRVNNPVDIMVPPHLQADFREIAALSGIPTELFMQNVQENVEQTEPKQRNGFKSVGWTEYHTLDEVRKYVIVCLQILLNSYVCIDI